VEVSRLGRALYYRLFGALWACTLIESNVYQGLSRFASRFTRRGSLPQLLTQRLKHHLLWAVTFGASGFDFRLKLSDQTVFSPTAQADRIQDNLVAS